MNARLITDKDEGMVAAILNLQNLFPNKVEYDEWNVWDNLQNLNNMNIIVEESEEIIGYVLGIPQGEAVEYLKKDDPMIENCCEMFYVDQIAVIKDRRDGKVFRYLVDQIAIEAKKRGYTKWSSHLMRGMENALRKMYEGKIIRERQTRMAAYGNHELVYMEGWI